MDFGNYLAAAAGWQATVTPALPRNPGAASAAILKEVSGGDYELIVAGPTSVTPIAKATREVAARAGVSVLATRVAPDKLRRILVCTGARPISSPVIDMGAKIAGATGAQATLLHVSSAVPSMYTGLPAMEETLGTFMKADTPEARQMRDSAGVFEEHGVDTTLELRHGPAAQEILRSCDLTTYDLLVIGATDTAPRINQIFFGTVTQEIVARAPVSVLVVRD